jgi:hypothetical protein
MFYVNTFIENIYVHCTIIEIVSFNHHAVHAFSTIDIS